MVTLHGKKQQQEEQPRRRNSRERVAAVEEDDWNQERLDCAKTTTKDDDNDFEKDDDGWRIEALPVVGLKINSGSTKRSEEIGGIEDKASSELSTRVRINGDVAGSNGESIQCSDLEDDEGGERELGLAEEEEEEDIEEDDSESERSDGWIRSKVITTRVQHETSFDGNDGENAVLPHLDDTTFGQVAITNSQHVHVGNTNFYKGPVTIKQFVYTNAYPLEDKPNGLGSNHIAVDVNCTGRSSDINPNDVPIIKGDPNAPILPSYRDYDSVTKWLWTWRCAAIMCVLALILVTVVAVVSVLLSNGTERRPKVTIPVVPTSGYDPDDNLGDTVRFIERGLWGAQPPTEDPEKLKFTPTPYVIISHTATEPCFVQSDCVFRVRTAQTYHIESYHWSDIAYNFLVGGDGLAYVGRGWDAMGAHSFGWNDKSIGISFIGTFNSVEPNKEQIHAAKKVIEYGVQIGKISPTYKLLGHRQVSKTLSPGDELYNILSTWDHWSPIPPPTIVGGSASTNHPHPFVAIPVLVLIIPHLILLIKHITTYIPQSMFIVFHHSCQYSGIK